jgi:glucoamylase
MKKMVLEKTKSHKIKKLIEITKNIIQDCSLENGGIVAANSTKNSFPIYAKNYFYVWPRDASFACIASDMLGIKGVQENFFTWCTERAVGFKENGVFYEKYHPNGLKALSNFQPDQTGAVLFALWHHYKDSPNQASIFHDLIKTAATGICNVWDKDHFKRVTNDLWEERFCFPDLYETFSYSLAACIRGLECADKLIPNKNPNKKWLSTATQMRNRLDKHCTAYFARSFGKIPDIRIDASIIGLVYPFDIYNADDPRIVSSIKEIEKKLIINGGIHRYEHDEYDGWMYETMHRKKGAGAWPLLNLWMATYYSIKGDKAKAEKYYFWVLERIKNHIPEQIFENEIQVSISPLLWSHCMFAIASKYLHFV